LCRAFISLWWQKRQQRQETKHLMDST
jgi:hypothetical protein